MRRKKKKKNLGLAARAGRKPEYRTTANKNVVSDKRHKRLPCDYSMLNQPPHFVVPMANAGISAFGGSSFNGEAKESKDPRR